MPPAPKQSRRMWRFFTTAAGNKIVQDEMKALGTGPRAALAEAMKRLAKNEPLPRETETVRGDIKSLKATYAGEEYRALYASQGAHDEVLLAVRVTEKKTRKLPPSDIRLAEGRLAQWKAEHRRRQQAGKRDRKGLA